MIDLNEVKKQILTDDKVYNAVEYLLSKVILDKPLPQLKFIFKKHKIILGRNGLYSVYKPDGKKLFNHIHFQEVAKYVVLNRDNPSKCEYILYIESEMFRHKEKIEFFSTYNNYKPMSNLESKISAMYDFYYQYKNSLVNLLQANNLF